MEGSAVKQGLLSFYSNTFLVEKQKVATEEKRNVKPNSNSFSCKFRNIS